MYHRSGCVVTPRHRSLHSDIMWSNRFSLSRYLGGERPANRETRTVWKRLSTHLAIVLLYLALGFSLGCYYTATYFGGSGWPLPSCEAVSGVLLYYFSVINTSTEMQAFHWMAVFVAAGYLWIASLWHVSNRLTGSHDRFIKLGLPLALATIPMSLPIPFMVIWMGGTSVGFVWSHFVSVCLRRAWVNPPIWLNYVYSGLAIVALTMQIAIIRRKWGGNWKRFLATLALAFGLLLVAAIGTGTLLSYPLSALLE